MADCNVIPSEDGLPRDMYASCVKNTQALWGSVWRDQEFDRINQEELKNTQKQNDKIAEEGGTDFKTPRISYECALSVDDWTRDIVKRPIMCSSYGASWKSKHQYVKESLEDKGIVVSRTEAIAATNAVVKGQQMTYPVLQRLDAFFNTVAKLCLSQQTGLRQLANSYRELGSTRVQGNL